MRTQVLLIAFAVWFVSYNSYFGWNRLPGSPEELICDGIGLLMLGQIASEFLEYLGHE